MLRLFSLALKPKLTRMFDFEKLNVYRKEKSFNSEIRAFIKEDKLDPTTTDQLRRSAV
ncbi:MAG: hypothetical protein AAF843_19910 [Bacteroidota bacterium]